MAKKTFTVEGGELKFYHNSSRQIYEWFGREKLNILDIENVLKKYATEKEFLIYNLSDVPEYLFIDECYTHSHSYFHNKYGKSGLIKLKSSYGNLKHKLRDTENFINNNLMKRLYEN